MRRRPNSSTARRAQGRDCTHVCEFPNPSSEEHSLDRQPCRLRTTMVADREESPLVGNRCGRAGVEKLAASGSGP